MIWNIVAASPTPAPTPGFDVDTVTPGVWGFVLTIGVILAVIVLIVDMVRRIRRVNYRAQVREQLAAEQLAAGQLAAGQDVGEQGTGTQGTGKREGR